MYICIYIARTRTFEHAEDCEEDLLIHTKAHSHMSKEGARLCVVCARVGYVMKR